MVLIEPEPEAEETVRPSSPPPPAARAEEVEEAFEDALPEEQLRERLKSFWKDKTGDVFLASQIHAGINRFQIDMTKYPILARLHDAYMEIPTFQASLSQNQPDAASS